MHQIRQDAALVPAETEHDLATASPYAAVVVLPQRMVVRDAAVLALLRIERLVQLPRKRVHVLKLRARRRGDYLIAQRACGTGNSQTRADLEGGAPVHRHGEEGCHVRPKSTGSC